MQKRAALIVATVAAMAAGCAANHQQRGPQVAHANCAGLRGDNTVAQLYSPGNITKVEPIERTELTVPRDRAQGGGRSECDVRPSLADAAYLKRVLPHAVSRAHSTRTISSRRREWRT